MSKIADVEQYYLSPIFTINGKIKYIIDAFTTSYECLKVTEQMSFVFLFPQSKLLH